MSAKMILPLILGMLVVAVFPQDELPPSPGDKSKLSDAMSEWLKKAEQGNASAVPRLAE